jgi:hypothetical protein
MTGLRSELHGTTAGQLIYNREKDGTSYWVFQDSWIGAPRTQQGQIDLDCIFRVEDMSFADHKEMSELYTELNLFSFRFK